MAPEERRGKNNRTIENEGFGIKQNMQIGSEFLTLPNKERLRPKTTRAAMIVVSRNSKDGNLHRTDRLTSCGNNCIYWTRTVKEVTGDQNERRIGVASSLADATEAGDPLGLQAGAFGIVIDPLVGLAELPIGSVEEFNHLRVS
jgi:hypothetical protein